MLTVGGSYYSRFWLEKGSKKIGISIDLEA